MKEKVVADLRALQQRLRTLKGEIRKLKTKAVAKKALRTEAESLASFWVESIRSPLEHHFKLPADVIARYAESFKRLHILSRPNNLVTSYLDCLDSVLAGFDDELILPIQVSPPPRGVAPQLAGILARVPDEQASEYLAEAAQCAQAQRVRAAIVMGWCAVVDRFQRKIVMMGLEKFNAASKQLKSQTSGRFKRFNKEFAVTTMSELQEVFDTDLLWVLEGMGLLDGNEGDRLRTCFQYRNQSAHPGNAPIEEVHLVAFFNDIVQIVLANPNFALTA
jgi:hypothetical protein